MSLQLPAELADRLAVIEERLDRLENRKPLTPAVSPSAAVRTTRIMSGRERSRRGDT